MAPGTHIADEHELLKEPGPIEVIALQPSAIVDHVCSIDSDTLRDVIDDEIGGSRRVEPAEIQRLLAFVGDFTTKAGGSAANTVKGPAGRQVSVRGQDEQGAIFASSMRRAGVDTSKLRVGQGSTGRCVILSSGGQRTMRTCFAGAARLQAEQVTLADFAGAAWLFASGYCLYSPGLLQHAVDLAREAGLRVALDLASFEVVRAHRAELLALLATHAIDTCFCNEDEAIELAGGPHASGPGSEAGLALMADKCEVAVVTLGERGCLVRTRSEPETLREPATPGVAVVDATGAGDLFASGFLYGLARGWDIRRCAALGCLAGGAVVQAVGAEMSRASWRWLFARLHGDLAASVVRDSASAVQRELLECYALIAKLGRGVVYYGSARLKADSPHWDRARVLGRHIAQLLGVTTWSGGGPGMMEAATLGALDAGGAVGGIRISREAGTIVRTASYLPPHVQVFCRFLSSRKVALVDAGVRGAEGERTAYVFLPGGLGTMDELFEILTLMQLRKLGSKYPVPLVLCNYDGFYNGLMAFLQACVVAGTLAAPELRDVVLASSNEEVLGMLAAFYGLQDAGCKTPIQRASDILQSSTWNVEAKCDHKDSGDTKPPTAAGL